MRDRYEISLITEHRNILILYYNGLNTKLQEISEKYSRDLKVLKRLCDIWKSFKHIFDISKISNFLDIFASV